MDRARRRDKVHKRHSARNLLRLLLVVQLLAVAALAALLHLLARWQWPAAWATALAALVLVRALIFSNNFMLSAVSASVTPPACRPDAWGWLRLWGGEFVASMLQSSWYGPRGIAPHQLFDSGAVPVLLVHGYGGNGDYWSVLARALAAQRISHASVDLEPLTGAIDDYAGQIEAAVQALCAATGAPKVAIVAHSMGGLASRAWLRRYGSAQLARLITLGTPHHGTTLANAGVGANARQMRRSRAGQQSEWLAQLDAFETAAPASTRALITSIYSHQDNIVSPQTSSCLAGARLIAFGGVGHVALGRARCVRDCILAELAELGEVGAHDAAASGGARTAAWTAAPPCG